MIKWSLFTDGGARGNPGPAAIGGVLFCGNSKVEIFSQKIGNQTNNYAEYSALIAGLKKSCKHGVEFLVCYLDSELVVKQLNGQYKIKDAILKDLALQVRHLSGNFKQISFIHIPREKNTLADLLVNKALDNQ